MTPHPATLGPYPVERELGRGGMGVVYLARDVRLDRLVAIKLLSPAFASDPEHVARFDREARLLASMVVFHATTPLAWAGDSRRLFYGAAVDKIMMVTIQTTPVLHASEPEVAYDLRRLRVASDVGSQWDILPDGRLIAIQKGEGEQDVSSFSVVLDWFDELRTRVGRNDPR